MPIGFLKTSRIVVLIDRDDDDCKELKAELERIASSARLSTKSTSGGLPFKVVNRLAIEELEAWFFGDWEAVRKAYPKVPATIPNRAKYRIPDAITGGTWENFERVLRRGGYFMTGLRKIEAAREIARHMQPAHNRSKSFQVFYKALLELAEE